MVLLRLIRDSWRFSLWIVPVIIIVLWIAIQFGLGHRHRHRGV
jgi:cytochrome c-type biogenesis protein CcmH/NrfF